MSTTPTFYVWMKRDSDLIEGLFTSVEEALADAKSYAVLNDHPMLVDIFNCRVATEAEEIEMSDNESTGPVRHWVPDQCVRQEFVG